MYIHEQSLSIIFKTQQVNVQDIPDCLAVRLCYTGIQWTVAINKITFTISDAEELEILYNSKIIVDKTQQFLNDHNTYILNVVSVILRVPANDTSQ